MTANTHINNRTMNSSKVAKKIIQHTHSLLSQKKIILFKHKKLGKMQKYKEINVYRYIFLNTIYNTNQFV